MNQHQGKSKEELEQEMLLKNSALLAAEGGIASLLIFNLENFAHRYIETSGSNTIKCQVNDNDYYVESVEENILEALKWPNQEVKAELIKLCKEYPGSRSKEIQVKMKIGTIHHSDTTVTCHASINWDFPTFQNPEKGVSKTKEFVFDDPIELRNKHAAILESVCGIF